jgi:hypothetical protein
LQSSWIGLLSQGLVKRVTTTQAIIKYRWWT